MSQSPGLPGNLATAYNSGMYFLALPGISRIFNEEIKEMRIAVLSDTHGLLRPEVIKVISECDAVLHAGDINSQKIIDRMKDAAGTGTPVYVVRGNNDKEWAEDLPHHLEFTLGGVNFYMVHNKKDLPKDPGDRQILIFGHSHKYYEEEKEGRLYLNPGSCGKRRFHQDITMAVLETGGGKWSAERIDIPHEGTGSSGAEMKIPEGDLLAVIEQILKRMDRGQQVQEIARALKIDPEFAEQICRIRVTHPGVTARGILDKLEVNKSCVK